MGLGSITSQVRCVASQQRACSKRASQRASCAGAFQAVPEGRRGVLLRAFVAALAEFEAEQAVVEAKK